MARLLSVNVGLPRDVQWNGRVVHTGIWKRPVQGSCWAGRLNLQGDGQGDVAGHGGEQRAVFVYQIESYRFWERQLNKTDFVYGQFGENFTVEGLPDDAVCIGDRFEIGNAWFEVTQPRTTCYRVGIRLNEPRMPMLLTASGRPGFYFRVLREGHVRGGDAVVKIGEAKERMTVAEVNALLYSADHPRERLERALKIEALSPGWRWSFEALLQSAGATSGNTGLAPASAAHPAAPGFQPLVVTALAQESADVVSLTLQIQAGGSLPAALPGQYIVLRLTPGDPAKPIYRSYSLSGPVSKEQYRISVKIRPDAVAGAFLRKVRVGDTLDVSSPRGSFVLQPGEGPVVLLSAGIGVTPVLAMLHALASANSNREVLWLHAARDRKNHPFAEESRRLVRALARGRSYVCYSRPGATDKIGDDFNKAGQLSQSVLGKVGLNREADVYLCGPPHFMADMTKALLALNLAPDRIRTEFFNGGESLTPGLVGEAARLPHLPDKDTGTGVAVSFARSGIVAHWDGAAYQNILELAEACDVPVRWSCRVGVCHNCETGLISGEVSYEPKPLDSPAVGNLLVCCSRPASNIVVDL